jgi:AraC-like DNA-binding protein
MQSLALDLVTRAATQRYDNVRSYSRRTTAQSRRVLVSDACEVLHAARQDISLVDLADAVGCSPFHLSRVFGEITGMTIPQYRRQLRVHEAVTQIAAGATDLAAIAATVGFADHSHMTRSIVAQFGATPSRLRELLRAPVAAIPVRTAATD